MPRLVDTEGRWTPEDVEQVRQMLYRTVDDALAGDELQMENSNGIEEAEPTASGAVQRRLTGKRKLILEWQEKKTDG